MRSLLLCMTPGVSIRDWESLGLLRRELSIYNKYVESGWNVGILTFNKDDADVCVGDISIEYVNKYVLVFFPFYYFYLK